MRLKKIHGRSEREKEPGEQEVVFKSNIGVYVFKVKVFLSEYRFCVTMAVNGRCTEEMEAVTFRKSKKCEVINVIIHNAIKVEKALSQAPKSPVDVGKGPVIGLEMTESGMGMIELDVRDAEEQSFA